MAVNHPTGKAPRSVVVVSLGPTKNDYTSMMTAHEPEIVADEVWTINTGLRWCVADLAFIMDDLLWYATRYPAYGDLLRKSRIPIITNRAYPEFPRAVEYPLAEVIDRVGEESAYFHNSVPYVLAYALHIGVQKVTLFGCDYTFPGTTAREDDRANAEYWVGYLRASGVQVFVPSTTTLLSARRGPYFYGYLRQPILKWAAKQALVELID